MTPICGNVITAVFSQRWNWIKWSGRFSSDFEIADWMRGGTDALSTMISEIPVKALFL